MARAVLCAIERTVLGIAGLGIGALAFVGVIIALMFCVRGVSNFVGWRLRPGLGETIWNVFETVSAIAIVSLLFVLCFQLGTQIAHRLGLCRMGLEWPAILGSYRLAHQAPSVCARASESRVTGHPASRRVLRHPERLSGWRT
jgi:hypothetical protein